MSAPLLVLRPQPDADRTARRVRALGLAPVIAPLFTVRPLIWTTPAAPFDAVMLTSANAARHGGDGLTSFLSMPCYAVGAATAAAARATGFTQVFAGASDGNALVERMAADGVHNILWLSGADRTLLAETALRITPVAVYAADPVARLPVEAEDALAERAVVLLHSARAAAFFRELVGDRRADIRIAVLSNKVAQAAGPGWAGITVAGQPRDEALLELAAKLCQTGSEMRRPHA